MAIKRWMPVESFQDWAKCELIEVARNTQKPATFQDYIDTEEILESFKKTPYYTELIEGQKILAIYLIGSRSIGLQTPSSDLDLLVVLDHKKELVPEKSAHYLMYKGLPVHYNTYCYDDLFTLNEITKTERLFVQQLFYNCEPYAVYLSKKGVKLHNFFIENRKELLTLGAKLVALTYKQQMNGLGIHPIRAYTISKWLYHPVMAYEILSDTVNTQLLLNLKSCTLRSYDKYEVKASLLKPLSEEVIKFNKLAATLTEEDLQYECDAVNNKITELLNK